MLHIIRSNRVESLLEALGERLAAAPLASPFTPEVVVAPSPAMARWVNLGLARRDGVAANVDYPLPASFVWRLAADLLDGLPEADPLALEVTAWKVFGLLPPLLEAPAFAPLARYLEGDGEGLKRWQLAGRIADVLDRYQLYRPELIRAWDAGDEAHDWQAELWRRLTAGIEDTHRVAVIGRLLAVLGGPAPAAVPERVSVFAVSSLPPLLVEVLQALATRTAVDLYLHVPTDAFWADLVSQKELARKRLDEPEEADLWEVGNSLLSSWGRQGQALQDLLLARELPLEETDAYVPPGAEHLLERVQQDIYALRGAPPADARPRVPADDSLQVHVCHSPLRECQVLHDRLLAMLDADPDLRPEDILVMIPEISTYAPYVEAVFGQDGERGAPFIPWNLSDLSVRDEHPLVQVFLQLLDLPESRFGHAEVLSYLDVPELAGHFGLDAEAVAAVRAWLEEANLRWGLDADHKRRLGLPEAPENTWAQAEQRLFGGYALGDVELYAGIAPVASVEGAGAEALGRFWRLLARLSWAAGALAAPRPAPAWRDDILAVLAGFFGDRDDDEGRLQKIRDAVADLADEAGGVGEPLSRLLVRRWLEARLGGEARRGRYFSGGVSFCGMRPMRSLPFRVICVLGLQEQAFPRRDRMAELDRMRRGWRPGDPRKGDEDRYLFLETLLCARRRLYLSYTGRDLRRNTERQPSVLVRELLDALDQHYLPAPAGAGGGKDRDDSLSRRVVHLHPLQPFSPRGFTGPGPSYDAGWCEVARALAAPVAEPLAEPPAEPLAQPQDQPAAEGAGEAPGWTRLRLPEAPEAMRSVTLAQLERFLRHPVQYFVNTRLQVFLTEEAAGEDEEAFALDRLQGYLLKQRLVAGSLREQAPSRLRLSAEGALPHGALADIAYAGETAEVAPLVERLTPFRGQRPAPVPLDLSLDGEAGPLRLGGLVEDVYPGPGLLRWRPGRLRGGDVLGLWVAHLAWCASGEAGEKRSTLHGTEQSFAVSAPVPAEAARAALARYLDWYWEGVHRPLLVLPRATYAYACGRGGRGDPLNAARREWMGNDFQGIPGDRHDPYVALVLRGTTGDPLAHADFPRLAAALYAEALGAGSLA